MSLALQSVTGHSGARSRLSILFRGVEYFPERLDDWLEHHRRLFLLLFSVLYLLGTARIASRRFLWADEVLTAYMTRLRLQELWSALASGVDLEPPLFHLITRAFTSVFGESPLAIRMPAILGGWLMSVSLFQFVSRRFRTLYAGIAMLIPFVTGAAAHTYEARSYCIALGFTGLALVSWQCAVERPRRGVCLIGLGSSLAAAIACHYYMVLALLAIGLAEAVRSFSRKKIDVPVWIALAAGLIPLPLHASLIRTAMTFSGGAWWSTASLGALVNAYQWFLLRAIIPAVLVITGLALFRFNRLTAPPAGKTAPGGDLPASELCMVLVLASSLVGAFVIARLTNGIFSARYGVCLVFGFSILPLPVISRYDAVRPLAGALSFVVLLGSFLAMQVLKHQERFHTPELLLRADKSLAIVIDNPLDFIELAYNAPPEIASRLHYLASRADSLRYAGTDDDDRGLLLLRQRFAIGVEAPDLFFQRHTRFLVWQGARERWWLLPKLITDGASINLAGALEAERLYLVTPRAERL